MKIITPSGQRIPDVSEIRVLGLLLNKSGRSDETISKTRIQRALQRLTPLRTAKQS